MRLPCFRRAVSWVVAVAAVGFLAPNPGPAANAVTDEPFFPKGVFNEKDQEPNEIPANLIARDLKAMGEPSLWKLSEGDEDVTVYRLLWMPSFHPAVAVRIVRSHGSYVLRAVELDRKDEEKPGKISVKKEITLNEEQWTWLQVYLERAEYWRMRTVVNEPDFADGAWLMCEGVRAGRYHAVFREDADLKFETLCWYMLRLSGLDVRKAWLDYHGDRAFERVP